MTESDFERNDAPHLTQSDIEALAKLARDFGTKREADFPQIGVEVEPLFHTWLVDAATIGAYNKKLSKDTDLTILGAKVEYHDAMEDLYGHAMDEDVAVEMTTLVSAEEATSRALETRYVFMLDNNVQLPMIEEEEVIITRSSSGGGVAPGLSGERVHIARGEPYSRPLTAQDVRLLKLLISPQ